METEKKVSQKTSAPASENATVPVPARESPAPEPAKPSPTSTSTPKVPAYGRCQQPCSGSEKVFLNSRYNKWIKVVLCSSSRYDILMGESQSGPFYKVGDTGGHGQDHCELVNNNFSALVSDDDVKSGNCPTCVVPSAGSVTDLPDLFGKKIYYRSKMGEPFVFDDAVRAGIHTSCWYECGVTF